jgi:aromatic-L-amino-acid/L-tryptophan decarboxylase
VKLRDKTAVAHLEGIVAARHAAGVRPAEASKTVVYLTSETHHCIEKALRICGLAECIVRQAAVDERRPSASGSSTRGAGGSASGFAAVARGCDRWHDRRWRRRSSGRGGRRRRRARSVAARRRRVRGFFVLTTHGRAVLAGIERSRTVVMDPHKGLFLPFGSGALIVRDERQLAQAHRYSADYLADARGAGVYSASDLSVELSRPVRGCGCRSSSQPTRGRSPSASGAASATAATIASPPNEMSMVATGGNQWLISRRASRRNKP